MTADMTAGMTPVRGNGSDQELTEQQTRRMLRSYGLRSTSQRLALLSLLSSARGTGTQRGGQVHLSAAQIHERLAASGDRMDAATVYRTLTTLASLGVLHAISHGPNLTTYGLAAPAHHHAVCTACGSVAEIPAAELAGVLAAVVRLTGFRGAGASVTVRGLCAGCQAPDVLRR